MTTTSIRKKLINYIAGADEKKVKGMYLLFEDEIESEKSFILSDAQLKILDQERKAHINGESKSYTWAEAKKIIRGKKQL